METSEILFKAADVIVQRGWWNKGWMPDGENPRTCPVCVLAAINVAAGRNPDAGIYLDPAAEDAALALAIHLGEEADEFSVTEIVGETWNDGTCETAEQAISALREAAQAEAEAGR
ncbi:MAG TPA: hypothetical protein VGF29_00395 [Hyphomicrobiaceae bacterium]